MALASLVVIPGALAYGETGWRDLLTLDTFFEHIRRTSDKRIGEFVREPLPLRLGLIALYASALAGGALFRVAERRSLRMLALLPFGIVLAYVALTSTKAPAMFVAYLWLAGWLVASLGRSGQSFSILQPRYVALFTLFWVAALPLTYLFTAIRRRELGTIYSDEAASAIDTYFFSHLATFSHWFHTQAFNPDPLNWGRYTFAGLADFLGLSPRLPGVYETVVTVGPRGETSNLFTVFRGLISDFSLPGAMLLLFAFGLLAGLAWRRLTAGDARMAPWVALFYLFAFTSNLYSPFLFNSIIGAWVLFALALWLPARLGQRLKAAT
jgi:oligosaccharide repeat unit polymerase